MDQPPQLENNEPESSDDALLEVFDDDDLDRLNKGASLAELHSGQHIINFSDAIALFDKASLAGKVILMVLLLALKDRASDLLFESDKRGPDGSTFVMKYKVNGEFLDLVPPPTLLIGAIRYEFKRMAGFLTLRRRIADVLSNLANKCDSGLRGAFSYFYMIYGEDSVVVRVTIYDSVNWYRIELEFLNATADLSDPANDALFSIFEQAKSRKRMSKPESEPRPEC